MSAPDGTTVVPAWPESIGQYFTWKATMANCKEDIAFCHASILIQKTDQKYARSDYITKVDFAYDWDNIWKNWGASWEKKEDGTFKHTMAACAYFSVVKTHTHYKIFF